MDNVTLSIPEKQEDIDNNIAKILLRKELDSYFKMSQLYQKKIPPCTLLLLGNAQRLRRTIWKVKEVLKRSTRIQTYKSHE